MKGGNDLKTTGPKLWMKLRGPAVCLITTLSLLLPLAIPSVAAATSLTGNSNTYILSREDANDTNLLPFYEYLDFAVHDLGSESLSAHFGGWLGFDMVNHSSFVNGEKTGKDLQYGYLSFSAKENNAVVNLGRVMVFEGVANERVDGLYARTDIKGGFGISAFGGIPVETGGGDTPGNNTIYGARVSHQYQGLYSIGLSFLKEDKNSNTFRKEEGIDLWLKPMNKVELMGRSSYNAETKGWMENAYYLILGPFASFRFNTEFSTINYEDYFAGTTSNVFKFQPTGPIDPKEKVKILGEEAFWSINNNWAASADYKNYDYTIAGSASYYGAKLTYNKPKEYSAGAAIHRMDGDVDRLKYDEYRVYASMRMMEKLDVTVDLFDVKYKQAINGVTNAYSAALAAGYELMEKLKVGVDVEYSKNPDFNKDVRLLAKLNYGFDVGSGASTPKEGK